MDVKVILSGIREKLKSAFRWLTKPDDPKGRAYSAMAFGLPFVLLLVAYFASGLYPFGNNSSISFDLAAQYSHFFMELKSMLADGESILYSWHRTLGGEFFGMIAYYLLSPFNILIFILPNSISETAILLTILGKTGLIGLFSNLYFRRGMGVSKESALIFSTAYALCSYSVAYGSNLMWLDSLMILPVLFFGIERLVRKEGNGLYVFALAYAMITNYYMGYMLCILTVVYFFAYRFGEYADGVGEGKYKGEAFTASLVRIGVFSLIALAISAVVLLPAYASLSFGKTDFTVPDFTPSQTADFLAILKKTLIGSYDSAQDGVAFIYSGILSLILAPAFFFSGGIGKREKIASGILLCFIFGGFFISTLNLVWHGFQFPNGLTYRFSFIFSLFICKLGAKGYENRESCSYKAIYGIFAYLVLAIFCIQAQHYSFGDDLTCIWLSLAVLAVYFAVIAFMRSPEKKKYLSAVLTVCVCIELLVASSLTLDDYDADAGFSDHGRLEDVMEKYRPVVEAIYEADGGFYRVERIGKRFVNDPLSLGLRGISGSTSTLNASVIALMEQVGYGGDSNFANYFDSAPVADSIFGIKYLISDGEVDNGVFSLNEELTAKAPDGVFVYENPLALSAVFTASSDVFDLDLSEYRSTFEACNALLSALVGLEVAPYEAIKLKGVNYGSVFPTVKDGHTHFVTQGSVGSDGYHSISFDVPTEAGKPLFVCLPSEYKAEGKVYVNGEFAFDFDTTEGDSIRSLGEFGGETVNVRIRWNKYSLALKSGISYFYQLNTEVLEDAYEQLSGGQAEISQFDNTRLFGRFTVSEGATALFTTVPYDGDWTLKVDGVEVETLRSCDALISADLSSFEVGEHTVELVYRSSSLTLGAVITVLGVAAYLGIAWVPRLIKKKQGDRYGLFSEDK